MLTRLTVRNLALAEQAEVEFESGLNVVTGETGAGKSIFIGALGLLLGERADKTLIRAGASSCTAEALFDVRQVPGLSALLDEFGLPPCEAGQLVIRRIVRPTGGQNFVNDGAVTLQTLRRIGDVLVDMHGPHDHQSLFSVEAQLEMLDAFSGAAALRDTYAAAFDRLAELKACRTRLEEEAGGDPAAQVERLEEQIREIDAAGLRDGEEEEVEAEHLRVANAQRILEIAGGVAGGLTDDDEAVFGRLAVMQRPLEEMERLSPEAGEWRREVSDLALRVQELSLTISGMAERIEADAERLAWLDERMALFRRLKRKYGGDLTAVRQTREAAEQALDDLRGRDERLAEIDQASTVAASALDAAGQALRSHRALAAADLAEAITGELEFLGFPKSSFAVDLKPCAARRSGMDAVEFGFAPNVGEAMRPLRAIASSGEISRLMLAIKAVLAEHDRVPVLVFDEIDANLGGELGHAVGRELRGVGERRQVICITHLPQVAACGAAHFAVAKDVRAGRTVSRIERLTDEERVAEVARMLGGAERETAAAHAADLLRR